MATSIASPGFQVGSDNLLRPTGPLSAVSAAASAGIAKSGIHANPDSVHDRLRGWLWSLVALLASSQLYFFRELFAAFAIFVCIFAVIAFLVLGLYMLAKCGEQAVLSMARFRQPAIRISRLADDLRKPA